MNPWLKKVFNFYVFAYAFFFASRPLSDGDFWWHLKAGEYIVKTRSVPKTDHFSFTNYGKQWISHEWLSEAIFYLVYSRLGFNVLIFIFALITAFAFWIVFRRIQAHVFIGAFATWLGVWSILPTIGVRPRVFTLLFASVYLALLTRYAREGEGRAIWWLVPIMAVWANLHAGYLLGLVFIAVTIVGVLLDAWSEGEPIRPLSTRLRTLSLVLLASVGAVSLNPHGLRTYVFPFEFFISPVQQENVMDWLSPDFHQPELMPLALLILLTVAAFGLSTKRVRPSELLLFLGTLYATLKSNRHMAIFALVAAPLLADHLQNYLDTTSLAKTFGRSETASSKRLPILLGVLLLLPLLIFVFRLRAVIYSPPRQEMVAVPLKAVEYMKENQITGNTFTDPNIWGGYLIWEMPSNPVFIDGRIDMYGDEFVRQFVNITRGLSDWREPFNRYGVQVAIVSSTSVLRLQLQQSPDWQQVYEDKMAVVFRRRS